MIVNALPVEPKREGEARLHPAGCFSFLLLAVLMAGCTVRPSQIIDIPGRSEDGAPRRPPLAIGLIPDAVPTDEPRSRYGNPDSYVVNGKRYYVMESSRGYVERGTASWYGTKFHGQRTSSGETYDMYAMTAAHKALPLPTYARVTNLNNGRSIVVKINDRGPFHDGRIIDLSYVAAAKLDMLTQGTAPVEVRALDSRRPDASPPSRRESLGGGSGALYIQVGAYSNRYNAEELARELARSLQQKVRVTQAGALYRVQVGPLANMGQADSLSRELSRQGFDNTRMVVE